MQSSKLKTTLAAYADRRLLFVFLMGCCSGFPWVLIGSNLNGWLADEGLSRTAIGLFGSVFVLYAVNFLWAPLLDRLKIPVLNEKLGHRRSWIVVTQSLMLVATLALSRVNMQGLQAIDPWITTLVLSSLIFSIALASATQDIAIDAFRIDNFAEHETEKFPLASAMSVIGWWTGYSVPGYIGFINADAIGWDQVYVIMAGFVGLMILATLYVKEPASDREQRQDKATKHYLNQGYSGFQAWFAVTVVEPFAEFFRRNGIKVALTLLLFVFLFKLGEAFLGRMSIVFYKDVGFTNEQIGYYSKLVGWGLTVVYTLIGSYINLRFGVIKGLFIGGVAMASSNLMFAWIAMVGPNEHLLLGAILVDNFTSAFATIAFVSFLTFLTGRAFSATQYALLASLGNLGRTTVASFSGMMVDWLDSWSTFFVITALMVIPGLVMLIYIGRHFRQPPSQNDKHARHCLDSRRD
ncbi:MFS transporter [Salinivibrio kushneri]|uniref:MFS transporter n=1 Tax=Salinivibrio kushneri TaxID=1908198 RepID=A0AB36K9R6_9GAMM|nr:MFS transporter [Salinivibrio kushneri]OOE45781.1 MFS transporter [Salinivibrio kushneri]OOE47700.1 MFS transporter [Salinivibrio kushneri]